MSLKVSISVLPVGLRPRLHGHGLADITNGEAVTAVVLALWPPLCLRSAPRLAEASASMSARSMCNIAGILASNPRGRRERMVQAAAAAASLALAKFVE